MKAILIIILFVVLFIYGCKTENSDRATESCIAECKSRLAVGEDFSKGPCLSNEIIEDWVCDVAHSPRQDIDNNPENQCSAYREGKAKHFVEVDENCNLIKAA